MKTGIGFQKTIVVLAGLVASGFLLLPTASAQDKTPPQQINFQFSGLIPGTTTGNAIGDPTAVGDPITDHPTRTGGFQTNYSYQFNRWAGVEAGIGLARYSQDFT